MTKILKWLGIILVSLVILFIGGTYFLFGSKGNDPAKIEINQIDAKTLHVIGEVDKKTGKEFLQALKSQPELETIIISSGGGDVDEAIKIASEIFDRKIKLVVEKYCFSSCLNYFIPAAFETRIEPHAVLGFHGSPQTFPGPIKLFVGKQIKNEKNFLHKLGLAEDIYSKLAGKRESYTSKHETTGMTFWMVDRSFFEENGFKLNPSSYFPDSQEELDKDSQRILDDPHVVEKKLVMYGDFN